MLLSFPPRPSPPRRKRGRAVTDIDGELSTLYKKKRRLRLFLITSRLSPQFSHPASNIVDRGSSKIAVWAKQRALGRNLLRKAAILNHIRRLPKEADDDYGSRLIEQEREQKELELARLEFVYGSHDTHTHPVLHSTSSTPATATVARGGQIEVLEDANSPSPPPSSSPSSSPNDIEKDEPPTYQSPNDAYSCALPRAQLPRRSYLPLPPSPLGLSNYDAFDTEDEIPDPYSHLDDDYPEDDQDDDIYDHHRSLSSNTLTSFTSTSTMATGTSEVLKTPPQTIYSDFSILDPEEPVVGDFDRIDDGADAIWPTTMSAEGMKRLSVKDNRSQQEAASPPSSSPNFQALFAPATAPVRQTSISPNFSAASTTSLEDLAPRAASPNFPPISMKAKDDAPVYTEDIHVDSGLSVKEAEQEKDRQKSLLFLRFNT